MKRSLPKGSLQLFQNDLSTPHMPDEYGLLRDQFMERSHNSVFPPSPNRIVVTANQAAHANLLEGEKAILTDCRIFMISINVDKIEMPIGKFTKNILGSSTPNDHRTFGTLAGELLHHTLIDFFHILAAVYTVPGFAVNRVVLRLPRVDKIQPLWIGALKKLRGELSLPNSYFCTNPRFGQHVDDMVPSASSVVPHGFRHQTATVMKSPFIRLLGMKRAIDHDRAVPFHTGPYHNALD